MTIKHACTKIYRHQHYRGALALIIRDMNDWALDHQEFELLALAPNYHAPEGDEPAYVSIIVTFEG